MKKQIPVVVLSIIALVMVFSFFTPVAIAGPIKLSYANFPPAPTFPCVQM